MRGKFDNQREAIYRATVTDTVSRQRVGAFAFAAGDEQEALPRAWRLAGRRFGNDIHVRIERISR
jgi:hypothetical protein